MTSVIHLTRGEAIRECGGGSSSNGRCSNSSSGLEDLNFSNMNIDDFSELDFNDAVGDDAGGDQSDAAGGERNINTVKLDGTTDNYDSCMNLINISYNTPKYYQCEYKDAYDNQKLILTSSCTYTNIVDMLANINGIPPMFEYIYHTILPDRVIFKYDISYQWLVDRMVETFPNAPFVYDAADYTRLDDVLVDNHHGIVCGYNYSITINNIDGRHITYRDLYNKLQVHSTGGAQERSSKSGDNHFLEKIIVKENIITLVFGS
jgi:hypothetical protein